MAADPPLFLAIETSSFQGSVSLHEGRRCLAEEYFGPKGRHGSALAPAVQKFLKERRLSPRDLTFVAVSLGPGSFTGLRVGISFALAFCRATRIPVVGVHAFRAAAKKLMSQKGPWPVSPLLILRNARRNRLYVGAYRWGEVQPEEVAGLPALVSLEEVLEVLPREATAVGDGLELLVSPPQDWVIWEDPFPLEASWIGRQGLSQWEKGENIHEPPCVLEPLYLMKTEAEERRGL